jgi:hypothetical protein
MDLTQLVHPTAGGLACAIGAVVAGAPLFRDGLRSLRLRRHSAALAERPLTDGLAGLVHVSGSVGLESPMFTPLSSAPCVGFQLEVQTVGVPIVRTVEERRPFRVAGPTASARLESTDGRWLLPVTAEREVVADEPLTEHLARLLGEVPEALWWRRAGGRLRLVERALLGGSPCHVVGFARSAHPLEQPAALELVRTGTDPTFEVVSASPAAPVCELWLGSGESLDFLFVSDRSPAARELAGPAWRTLGAFAGPALSLLGLLYLAAAAEPLRSLGRF